MNLNDFFKWTNERWRHSKRSEMEILYIITAGLAGETGEVCEVLKKRVRDGLFDKTDLILELGDVVHYWCRICKAFDIEPAEVLKANVAKLTDRDRRGKK